MFNQGLEVVQICNCEQIVFRTGKLLGKIERGGDMETYGLFRKFLY